ncbi:hypothetical protein BJI69_13660 [Luteibacter rhizovicinus DSM 16549]|uniref:Uncharacterized protein n=2 Tax=Luteibacter rhizovicinus TaxID=242606 RepID=A0A0G9HD28_9GAMM|nr:hypothetical protein BJI69_13660 [Luteibacter rhizovicinus DSM 16549]KLD67421.1 hypothetical protein Y883_07965 [Luteibacter rhizovicinus DSM 16549]
MPRSRKQDGDQDDQTLKFAELDIIGVSGLAAMRKAGPSRTICQALPRLALCGLQRVPIAPQAVVSPKNEERTMFNGELWNITKKPPIMDLTTQSYRARLLSIAEMSLDARALVEAASACEWDETRFLSYRIMEQALSLRWRTVAQAALGLSLALGPEGNRPGEGYGAAMIGLADAISALI